MTRKAGQRINVDWSELASEGTKREEAMPDKDEVMVD